MTHESRGMALNVSTSTASVAGKVWIDDYMNSLKDSAKSEVSIFPSNAVIALCGGKKCTVKSRPHFLSISERFSKSSCYKPKFDVAT